jgi:hypothetical protein
MIVTFAEALLRGTAWMDARKLSAAASPGPPLRESVLSCVSCWVVRRTLLAMAKFSSGAVLREVTVSTLAGLLGAVADKALPPGGGAVGGLSKIFAMSPGRPGTMSSTIPATTGATTLGPTQAGVLRYHGFGVLVPSC